MYISNARAVGVASEYECFKRTSVPVAIHIPPMITPLLRHRMMRHVELQWRDGDVAVAEAGDVRVVFGVTEGEDAGVPEIISAARVGALFVLIDERPSALPRDAHTRGCFAGRERGDRFVQAQPAPFPAIGRPGSARTKVNRVASGDHVGTAAKPVPLTRFTSLPSCVAT